MDVSANLWSPVGDALQDPADGRRVERQVLRRLHPLQHQLVPDALPADLAESPEQVEEVAVEAVLQLGGHLHSHLEEERNMASYVYFYSSYS